MTLKNDVTTSLALYDMFVKNAVDGKLSGTTLDHMKSVFASVADEDKATVFNVFLQFLQDDGIAYDVEQFQAA